MIEFHQIGKCMSNTLFKYDSQVIVVFVYSISNIRQVYEIRTANIGCFAVQGLRQAK